jgi:hypothetical protein
MNRSLLFEAMGILDTKEFIPLLRSNPEKGYLNNEIDSGWVLNLEELINEQKGFRPRKT